MKSSRPNCETLERRLLLCDPCPEHVVEIVDEGDGIIVEPSGGTPMNPDLIAWASQANSYIYGWEIDTDQIPGRTLLRLSTSMANIGQGALDLRGGPGDPNNGTQQVFQRVYDSQGGFTDRLAGNFIFHPEHEHVHFDDFADYRLRDVVGGTGVGDVVVAGHKVSFCLGDFKRYDTNIFGAPQTPQYLDCTNQLQGISVGWADVYDMGLPDQWIDVTGVAPGSYWLEVVVDPDNRLVESNENNNVTRIQINLDFGASISGTVFNDPNSNGAQDGGEAPLASWPVYLDLDNDAVRDADEPTATTDAAGHYTLGSLANGTFHVKQQLQAGYRKTLPGAGVAGYDVTIAGANDVTGKNFGATTNLYLAGTAFNDVNSNGVKDAGETGLAGVVVQIVSNNQTVATRTTDAAGFWQVKGLAAGTGEAKAVIPAGFNATAPQNATHAGSMTSGQQNGNLNFGLHQTNAVPSRTLPSTNILRSREDESLLDGIL